MIGYCSNPPHHGCQAPTRDPAWQGSTAPRFQNPEFRITVCGMGERGARGEWPAQSEGREEPAHEHMRIYAYRHRKGAGAAGGTGKRGKGGNGQAGGRQAGKREAGGTSGPRIRAKKRPQGISLGLGEAGDLSVDYGRPPKSRGKWRTLGTKQRILGSGKALYTLEV